MSSGNDSATSNSFSSPKEDDEAEEEDSESEWDEEEIYEEIMEIREVLERSKLTVSYLEESGDSLDNEDNELIKAKLRALRDYVSDLQASYNELLQTFKQLEDAAKQKVSTMEGKLSAALNCAKDFQVRCNTLESQLKRLHYDRHDNSNNDTLPRYTSTAQSQIDALEEDLSSVLKAISQGVESGVIKLSGLQLSTQEYPIPLQDVIISPHVDNGTTLSKQQSISDTRPHTHNESSSSHVTDRQGTTQTGEVSPRGIRTSPMNRHESNTAQDTGIHSINTDTHSTKTDTHSTKTDTHSTKTDTHSTKTDSYSTKTDSYSKTDVHVSEDHVTTSDGHVTQTPPSSTSNNEATSVNGPSLSGSVSIQQDYNTEDTPPQLVGPHPHNDHARRELLFQQIELLSKETQTHSTPSLLTQADTIPSQAQAHSTYPPQTQTDTTGPSQTQANTTCPPQTDSGTEYGLATPTNHNVLSEDNRPVPKLEHWNETSLSNNESKDGIHQFQSDDGILAQILEKDCRIAELETCVQDLHHKLQESHHLNESTQMTLTDTETELKRQRINEVMSTEGDLSEVMAKISHYESEREGLQSLVDAERNKVLQLEQQRNDAVMEMEQMKHKINTLTQLLPVTSSIEGDLDDKPDIDSAQLLVRAKIALNDNDLQIVQTETSVLESQRAQLHKQCSDAEDKVDQLQSSLRSARQEANRLQALMARKESELTKVISSIHTTRAKLASIHQTDRTPLTTNETVDDDINGIEWDVNTIKQKWEELCLDLSKHEAAIASLTGRELTLQSELDHRGARVIELESLLQARELGAGFNKKSVSSVQTTVELLKNELEDTKRNYTITNQEMIETCQRLQSSVHTLVDQLQLLNDQVSSKDKQISNLQTEQKQLWELYQMNSNIITEDETERVKKEESLRQLSNELISAQQRIEELEDTLDSNHELRMRDIDYQKAVITDLVNELQQINEEEDVDTDEVMEPESLKSKIDHRDKLLQTLQEQTSMLIERHSSLVQQTDQTHDTVNDLETKLLTAQTMCDALEQEVADGHRRLAQVQQQLIESEKERIQLHEQLETLRAEAEDTCNSLESALNKAAVTKQHSEDQLEIMRKQIFAQQIQQEQRMNDLNGIIEEKSEELTTLHSTIDSLQADNIQLHSDYLQHQTLVTRLKEELELNGSESLQVESMQIQLDNAESAKIVSDTIAKERLNDVMTLQQRNEELLLVNSQIKLKLSNDGVTSRDYQSKVDMLYEEMETIKALYDAKSSELDKMKYSYQLAMKKEETIIEQLDECRRELAICKKRADELDIRYQSTLSDLSVSQTELDSLRVLHSSDQIIDDGHSGQTFQLKTRIRKLSAELKEGKNECDQLHSSLQAASEEKRRLLHKLGALEEHYHSLIRTSSQQKLDMSRSKRQNEKQRKLCLSLQSEYDSLADQVSDWATDHKTTTEALVQKIREQDSELSSLKQRQQELMKDNGHLREQINHSLTTNERPLPLIELPQLHNQYQEILEKGLSSSSALDTSGYSSPSESTDELDKSYWIKRAGELSLQLQRSSQYWSAKVREQSLKIQKYETL